MSIVVCIVVQVITFAINFFGLAFLINELVLKDTNTHVDNVIQALGKLNVDFKNLEQSYKDLESKFINDSTTNKMLRGENLRNLEQLNDVILQNQERIDAIEKFVLDNSCPCLSKCSSIEVKPARKPIKKKHT